MSFPQLCLAKASICMLLMQTLSFMIVNSYPLADKIVRLPGQPEVSFQQFGGYITIDEKQERALFYYFVEAERDPFLSPLFYGLMEAPVVHLLDLELSLHMWSFQN
ncbi:Peptidase S10, serine carboxypeptidase [Trema orientale]|uniref:Peptidase S10, serine carboxypeptidase n=1 Tax=Trema orientale TaxID=63057 RepID=A0A2P5FRS0_TREOI|nr:Peptidase S10, serine carboxypeptidase [Trema orientale]